MNLIAYGVIAFAISLLHCVFVSFYIDYYFRVRHFDLGLFAAGQVVYAVWNSLNDLGFGWLGDTRFKDLVKRRSSRITIGGPLWALSFVLLWQPLELPILHPAIQYTLMMVVYDGFFSYTSVAFRALLPDIAQGSKEREMCNAVAAIFHLFGASSVAVAEYYYVTAEDARTEVISRSGGNQLWDSMHSFRSFTLIIGVVAGGLLFLAGKVIRENPLARVVDLEDPKVGSVAQVTPLQFLYQLFEIGTAPLTRNQGGVEVEEPKVTKRRSLPWLMAIWSIQEYSCSFATNFFSLFLAIGGGESASRTLRSVLLLLGFCLPHLATVLLTPLMRVTGRRTIVSSLFAVRFGVSLVALLVSVTLPSGGFTLFLILFLSGRVLTECVCRLQPLIAADAIDEDFIANERPVAMGGAIHGVLSLAAKPTQSLAPLLTCYYLGLHNIIVGESAHASAQAVNGEAPQHPMSSILEKAHWVQLLFAVTGMATSGSLYYIWRFKYHLPTHGQPSSSTTVPASSSNSSSGSIAVNYGREGTGPFHRPLADDHEIERLSRKATGKVVNAF
jgi:Na+/melibiose symporter-like transporter